MLEVHALRSVCSRAALDMFLLAEPGGGNSFMDGLFFVVSIDIYCGNWVFFQRGIGMNAIFY
jgi:hypothetical protein